MQTLIENGGSFKSELWKLCRKMMDESRGLIHVRLKDGAARRIVANLTEYVGKTEFLGLGM